MRKILIAGVFMLASLAQAEVLSWRVDIPSGNNYASAQLYATLASTADLGNLNSLQGGSVARYSNEYGVLTTDTTLTVNNTYKFFVALFAADGTTVMAYSALMTWDDLAAAGSLWSGSLPTPPGTTYWNAVPEPTSIGLLAVGMSALLLRRRRRM